MVFHLPIDNAPNPHHADLTDIVLLDTQLGRYYKMVDDGL
jgi:hypothetical protein